MEIKDLMENVQDTETMSVHIPEDIMEHGLLKRLKYLKAFAAKERINKKRAADSIGLQNELLITSHTNSREFFRCTDPSKMFNYLQDHDNVFEYKLDQDVKEVDVRIGECMLAHLRDYKATIRIVSVKGQVTEYTDFNIPMHWRPNQEDPRLRTIKY
jgi:hypothetical protein